MGVNSIFTADRRAVEVARCSCSVTRVLSVVMQQSITMISEGFSKLVSCFWKERLLWSGPSVSPLERGSYISAVRIHARSVNGVASSSFLDHSPITQPPLTPRSQRPRQGDLRQRNGNERSREQGAYSPLACRFSLLTSTGQTAARLFRCQAQASEELYDRVRPRRGQRPRHLEFSAPS
jgi:hypothetical protein